MTHSAPAQARTRVHADPAERCLALALCVALGLGLSVAEAARAQSASGYAGASLDLRHEGNLFRTPSGQPEKSDTIRSTGVLAGLELPVGRQRFYGDGFARDNRFAEQTQLDNVSYGLTTGLDWSTTERISGSVKLTANRNLASYDVENAARTTTRNIESSRQFDLSTQIGGSTPLTLDAGYQRRTLLYSAAVFDRRELEQQATRVGVTWRRSPALALGAGLRLTNGSYPRYRALAGGGFEADRFRRRDIDLSASWVPSGQSALNARLSVGRQTNSEATQYDFSGITGALNWTYQPTGKTVVVTTLSRDTGAENRFLNFGAGVTGLSDASSLSTASRVEARYDATAKLQLNASVTHTRRKLGNNVLVNNTGASIAAAGRDYSTSLGIGARYRPSRNLALECGVTTEDRRSDSALSTSYGANSANCAVRVQVDTQ